MTAADVAGARARRQGVQCLAAVGAGGPAPAATSAGSAGEGRGSQLDADDFRFFAALVYETSRIVLRPEKREMLLGRITKRLRALRLGSVKEYRRYLASDGGEAELGELINAVTTNLTAFFRETHHFEHLASVALPEAMRAQAARGSRRLRLWSAACSSGQEPYSMAMTLSARVPDLARWDARILATDLDTTMVATAEAGAYRVDQAKEIPAGYLGRHAHLAGGTLTMSAALRALIVFKPLNLIGAWPMRGPFDVIFCRNVVIYFDKVTQAELFDRLADIMVPEGWLYIGHSETLHNVSDRFELVGQTTYRRRG